MSLVQFLDILAARWKLIAGALLACLLAGLVTAFMLPARYEGRARLMLDLIKPDPVTGTMVATQFLRAYTRTQIELISDYRTTGRVVDQLGWANDPARIAAYEASGASATQDFRHWLAAQIAANTDAGVVESSNILEIKYIGPSPVEAQRIAGLLRDAFLAETIDFRRQSAQHTGDWYRQQAAEALARVNQAEAARAAYAKANNVVVSTTTMDLEAARLQALGAQSSAAAMGGGMAMAAGPNPLQLQLDALDQRIAQAATSLGPNHPQLQALRRERAALAANVGRGGGGAVRTGPSLGTIQREFEAQKARVIGQRGVMDRLNQMQGDIELQLGQYQKTAQRVADLELESQVADAGMTAMGGPTSSEEIAFPNRSMIILGAIAVGLGLGLVGALLLEVLKRRVRSDLDLEQVGGVPVFAVIGEPTPSPAVTRLLGYLGNRSPGDDDVAGGRA